MSKQDNYVKIWSKTPFSVPATGDHIQLTGVKDAGTGDYLLFSNHQCLIMYSTIAKCWVTAEAHWHVFMNNNKHKTHRVSNAEFHDYMNRNIAVLAARRILA